MMVTESGMLYTTCVVQFYASVLFFFSSRRRHTRWPRDWSSDVCSSDLMELAAHQRTPRELEHRPAVAPSRAPRQRRERLGHARERQLGRGIPSFERRPRPMHALEGPRVAIGPAQLTREGRWLRTVRDRKSVV